MQKGMIHKFLKSIPLFVLLLTVLQVNAQDQQTEANKKLRATTASGGWFSGGANTSFISIGQNGASALQLATGGDTQYASSFGLLGPISLERPNTAPTVSVSSVNQKIYPAGFLGAKNDQKYARVQAVDAEGDRIEFTIKSKNNFVRFVELETNFSAGSALSKGYSKLVNTYRYVQDTFPGFYNDVLVVKAVDERGEEKTIEQNVVQQLIDSGHEINTMEVSKSDASTQSLSFTLSEPILNSGYKTKVTMFAYNPSTLELKEYSLNKVLKHSDLVKSNTTTFAGALDLKSDAYPDLFKQGNRVIVQLDVAAEVKVFGDPQYFFNTSKSFYYEVTEDGGVLASNKADLDFNISQDLKDIFGGNAVTSPDGAFFTTSQESSTFESDPITIKLTAIEFGDFDLKKSTISITEQPKKGTVTQPVLVSSSKNLAEWTITYTPSGEVGYLDSLQFSVQNPERSFTASSYSKVEVINENDAPVIDAIDDQSIDEDQAFSLTLNYSDVDNEVTASAAVTDNTNFTVQLVGNQLTVTPKANFSGTTSVQVNVVENGGDNPLTATQNFILTVNEVNDSPVITAIPNQTVVEDNVFTYNLQTTDIDAAIPLFGYTITPSVQGVVQTSISGNNLTITPVANYNGNINFTLVADDGRGTLTSKSQPQTFTLAVSPVNDAPVSTATIPTQNIVDVLPAYVIDLGLYFDDIETADDDLTITQNSAGNLFTLSVNKDNLTVTPITGQNGSENVTFTVSDGEFSVTQTVTFNVQSNNTDITANAISDVVLVEDFTTHTINLAGVFTDSGDPNAVFTYTIGGLSKLSSSINGNNLVFTTAANFNGTEGVFLVANANGKTSFTQFNINVNPVNDAPTLGATSARSIQEDSPLSGVFMSFSDIDTDASNLTFTASSSNESLIKASNVAISKGANGITLSATPEANASGSATISVVVNDGELTATQQFAVNVLSVNDAPIVASTTISGATEDAVYNQAMTGLFNDVDGDNLTYTLEANPSWLSIANGNLVGTPTNDNVGSATFFITANDGSGGTVRQAYTIAVTNTNDAPIVATPLADITAAEDVLLSSQINAVAFNDIDGDNLTISASFNGASWLTFDPATLRFTGTPTASDIGTVNITLTATDPSGATVTDDIVLTVNNTNDAPTDLSLANTAISENVAIGTSLGALATTDEDSGDTFTYTLVSGTGANNNALFNVTDGELVTKSDIDFEENATLSVRIRSSDAAGASFTKVISITVNNVNEVPTAINASALTIAENAGVNAEIGTLTTTDPDNGDTFTYSLVTGTGDTDNAGFDISNGKLLAKSSLNFESKSSYSVRVKTQDAGGLTYEKALSISVTNVNEAPTALALSSSNIAENEAAGTAVGDLAATDEDSGDTFTFSLVTGTGDVDNGSFDVVDNKLVTKASFDRETKDSYQVRLQVEDAGGATFQKAFTVTVDNVVESSIASIAALNFGDVALGGQSKLNFTIDNTGETAISVTNITAPAGYTVATTSLTVAVGQTANVEITFAPSAAQQYNGDIVMESNVGETLISVVGNGAQVTSLDDDILDADEVKIYPNPSNSFVNIDLSDSPALRPNVAIIDISGKTRWSKMEISERVIRVDVSSFEAGTYLIQVNSKQGSVVKKLMVIK